MPFNIQMKGFIVGIIFAMFVLPYLQVMLSGITSRAPKE